MASRSSAKPSRRGQVLLVEDDHAIAHVISTALRDEGLDIRVVETIAARDAWLAVHQPDVLISDVMLPDGNALDQAATYQADMPVIVLSAQNTLDTAVQAAERGAFEYLPKPFDLDELIRAVHAALSERGARTTDGQARDAPAVPRLPLIGRAPAMQQVYRTIARLASSELSVLILGESGTGKELVAQSIHQTSPRRDGPFVPVNMAAIPAELIESELFGHEKGAFTGANARYSGRFEQARGGTLFLDEIGDMPLAAQTRLLRVLQTGQFSPLGSARQLTADVRIIAATNKNLKALVAANLFREDLFYRLNVIPLELPPLRDRRDDIGELARHFATLAQPAGVTHKQLSPSAIAALEAHDWPGNVRELENAMQRMMLLIRESRITGRHVEAILGAQGSRRAMPDVVEVRHGDLDSDAADVPMSGGQYVETMVAQWLERFAESALRPGALHADMLALVERPLLVHVLRQCGGNQLKTSAMLGINRNTLRKKMQELGLRLDR